MQNFCQLRGGTRTFGKWAVLCAHPSFRGIAVPAEPRSQDRRGVRREENAALVCMCARACVCGHAHTCVCKLGTSSGTGTDPFVGETVQLLVAGTGRSAAPARGLQKTSRAAENWLISGSRDRATPLVVSGAGRGWTGLRGGEGRGPSRDASREGSAALSPLPSLTGLEGEVWVPLRGLRQWVGARQGVCECQVGLRQDMGGHCPGWPEQGPGREAASLPVTSAVSPAGPLLLLPPPPCSGLERLREGRKGGVGPTSAEASAAPPPAALSQRQLGLQN